MKLKNKKIIVPASVRHLNNEVAGEDNRPRVQAFKMVAKPTTEKEIGWLF